MPDLKKRELFLSLLVISLFLVFMQASAPSLDSDGIHYASAAKEVARTGRWLHMFDPVIRTTYYWHFSMSVWPNAIVFKLLGTSALTAKLYSMLMTVAAAMGIFLLGRVLANPWTGWFSCMAFLLTDHVLRICRQCRPDLPLIGFIVWAFVGFVLAQKRSKAWYLLGGLATLGAIMTKEVSGVIPLLAVTGYLLLRRKWRELFHPMFLLSWVIAIGPVIGWIWYEETRFHDSLWRNYYTQSVLFFMHAEHLATPWYYYGWAILDKYWYFLPAALAGAWLAIQKIRDRHEPRWGIILLWAAILPPLFSLANHKIHYYILPTYAGTALLVGLAADRWIPKKARPHLVIGALGVVAILAWVVALFPVRLHKTRYAENIAMAPKIDRILAQKPGLVMVVRQDAASLFFYTQRIEEMVQVHDEPSFLRRLSVEEPIRRYCLIGKKDLALVEPKGRARWEVLLEDEERYFVRREPVPPEPAKPLTWSQRLGRFFRKIFPFLFRGEGKNSRG